MGKGKASGEVTMALSDSTVLGPGLGQSPVDQIALHSRESSLALLHVFALGSGSSFATQVNSNAHEQTTLVQEVAGDVHDHQEQDEDDNEDAHDGAGAEACGGAAIGLSGRERDGRWLAGLGMSTLTLWTIVPGGGVGP